jgi:hypothetical protein
MIEIYAKGKKKDKIEGYVDGKKYLTRKKKLWGYLEDNMSKDKSGYPLLVLTEEGKITLNEDWNFEELGYIKEGKIYYSNDKPIFSLDKDKGEIQNHLNGDIFYLRGEGIEKLDDSDFFGITGTIFELFAGGGSQGGRDDGEELGEIIGDFIEDLFDDD